MFISSWGDYERAWVYHGIGDIELRSCAGMHDSDKFHRPVCEKATLMTLPPGKKRPTTAPATGWTAEMDAAAPRKLRVAAGLAVVVIMALTSPRAKAGSADARGQANQAGWTTANHQRGATTTPNAGLDARLKWKAAPQPLIHDPALAPMREPTLTGPQVRFAVPDEADLEEPGKVRLTTFHQRAKEAASDPFQDEVVEGEEDATIGAEMEGDEISEELVEPIAENGTFDPEEVAQRGDDRKRTDLQDELQFDQNENLRSPSLGTEFAQAGPGEPDRCPSPRDLKPINQISHRIASDPGLFPQECALSDYEFQPRNFAPLTFTWKASALCHKPLYFQQPKLERYGHTFGPILTPLFSVGHFFLMVPCIPYNMGMELPWECVYPLGWYRPGDCAPYTIGPVPLSLRGAILQGTVTTGFWFLFQ